MAAQRLGDTVEHDVGSVSKRSLQHRRREGVVDEGECACGMGGINARRQVGDLEEWIGRRLQPEHVSARAGLDDVGRVIDLDDAQLDASHGMEFAQTYCDTRVGSARSDDHRTLRDEVHGGARCCHARREHGG